MQSLVVIDLIGHVTQIYFPRCCEAVVSHSFLACLVSMVTLRSLSLQRNPKAGSSSEVPAAFSTARRERQTCRGAGENAGRSHKSSKGQWPFSGDSKVRVLVSPVLAVFLEATQICSVWRSCFPWDGSFISLLPGTHTAIELRLEWTDSSTVMSHTLAAPAPDLPSN